VIAGDIAFCVDDVVCTEEDDDELSQDSVDAITDRGFDFVATRDGVNDDHIYFGAPLVMDGDFAADHMYRCPNGVDTDTELDWLTSFGNELGDPDDVATPGSENCPGGGGICDTPAMCDGDVNGDELVDPLDTGAILARFGLDPCNEETCQYDVNCDGVIDPLDTGYVLARFGLCDEPDVCKICEGLGGCCDADKTPEGEACGDDTNGGCNVVPPEFGSIECGEGICGTGWAEGDTRDTDWFLISVPDLGSGSTLVTATVESEFPAVLFIVDGIAACLPVVIGDIGCGDDCTSINQASAVVVPGDYVIFVAPGDCLGGGIFDGLPCGDLNSYTVTVTCEDNAPEVCDPPCPKGEECQDGVCVPEVCNCCVPHDGVGCDEPDCEALVCDADAFCCDVGWDQICSDSAIELCACCGGAPPEAPVNDDCANAVDLFDGVTAYSTIGATSAGPDLPPECDKFGVTLDQDIWYVYTATCTGEVSVSTCNDADYDTMLAGYEGTDCPPDNVNLVACDDDFAGCAGNTSFMSFGATLGTDYLVRVGGFSSFEGTGNLTVSCD
ncbi:MAG: hypothetical protein IIA44_14930, partial [Acidobacteria bacterium]|nr:hypothetical protein [Acidobacteriota bacterium]